MNPSLLRAVSAVGREVPARRVLPNSEGSNICDNVHAIHQFGIVDRGRSIRIAAPSGPRPTIPTASPTAPRPSSCRRKCWTQGDPSDAAKAAKKWFLPAGHFINTTDIKAHITGEHTAVGVGIDFFYQAWNHGLSTLPIDRSGCTRASFAIPNADDITESHKQRAGHGILIVGWDDDLEVQSIDKDGKPVVDADGKPVMQKGFYIFKNSWGTAVSATRTTTAPATATSARSTSRTSARRTSSASCPIRTAAARRRRRPASTTATTTASPRTSARAAGSATPRARASRRRPTAPARRCRADRPRGSHEHWHQHRRCVASAWRSCPGEPKVFRIRVRVHADAVDRLAL